jgi:phosphodiesterase/alkaline phosphatase D-like protein
MLKTRRAQVFLVATLIGCAGWLPAGARQQQPDTAPFAMTHGPYLQLPDTTSMTVVWHTNRPAVSRVEYWERANPVRAGAELAPPAPDRIRIAISAHHGLLDNDRTSHAIRLHGLKPGTTYAYRVISRMAVRAHAPLRARGAGARP